MPKISKREFFLRQIPRYRKDPVLFFREVLEFEPDDWQAEAASRLADHPRVTIRSGQGVGKTGFEAATLLWFLTCFPYPRVVATAPTRQQVNDVLWAEVAKWQERSPILRNLLQWTKTYIYMIGYEKQWFAVAKVSKRPESIQGFHADNMLIIVDEASGVPDAIMEAIRGTLTGLNNKLLMCGNPTKTSGMFYESHTSDAHHYEVLHVNSRNSPRTNKENIAALEEKYGKDSNVVRVRVDGEFPVAGDDVFFPSALAEKAIMTEPEDHEESIIRIAIGVDVARFGDDSTVLASNIDGDILPLITRHGQDLYSTADDIIAEYKRLVQAYPIYHGPIYANIDDTGLGGGVTDILNRERIKQKLKRLIVVPVNFGDKVPDKEAAKNFGNIATWMWSLIRDAARTDSLHLPNDADLVGQLSSRKYQFTGTPPKLILESKDALKKRELPSPDKVDAIALSFYKGDTFVLNGLIK